MKLNAVNTALDAIDKLPPREKLLMGLYYEEELNLKEIGAVMGVSESRVSQLHTQASMSSLNSRIPGNSPSPVSARGMKPAAPFFNPYGNEQAQVEVQDRADLEP